MLVVWVFGAMIFGACVGAVLMGVLCSERERKWDDEQRGDG